MSSADRIVRAFESAERVPYWLAAVGFVLLLPFAIVSGLILTGVFLFGLTVFVLHRELVENTFNACVVFAFGMGVAYLLN